MRTETQVGDDLTEISTADMLLTLAGGKFSPITGIKGVLFA
jgi:hypothetical protein